MKVPLPLALLAATPALAQQMPPPRIIVAGAATVSSPPDRAQIAYSVHGEGATSDEAVAALVAKRRAIDGGLAAFAARAEPHASQVAVAEARGRDCNRATYGAPRLSTGECAIVGYTADLAFELSTSAIEDAGTIVGLIGRLGATNPRIDRFFLIDDAAARSRALAAAIADARRQAMAIAAGSNVRLGRLFSVSNSALPQPFADDIVVTGSAASPPPPPPPPPPRAPIAIDLVPRPIETQARVTMVYEIAP